MILSHSRPIEILLVEDSPSDAALTIEALKAGKIANRLSHVEDGVDAMEFLRRFLQHVLPTGFMKVRYYGFLSPTSTVSLDEVRAKIELAYGFTVTTPRAEAEPVPPMSCKQCGFSLRYLFYVLPGHRLRKPPG